MVACTVLAGPAAGPINMGTYAMNFGAFNDSNLVAGSGSILHLNGGLTVSQSTTLGFTVVTGGLNANDINVAAVNATQLNGVSEITFADETEQTTAYAPG